MERLERHRAALPFVLLAALIYLALYARALGFGFFDDDFQQVGLDWREAAAAIRGDSQFRPLFWMAYPLANSVLGNGPFAHHLVNHGLHLSNCLLAYLVLAPRIGNRRAGIALVCWHLLPQLAFPLGWIVQRNDLLLTFFLLGAVLLHDKGRTKLAWLAAFASFLCKVTAVAFPLAFVTSAGLRRYPGDRTAGFLLFAAAVVLSAWAVLDVPVSGHLGGLGPALLALNAAKNLVLGFVGWWIPVPFFAGPLEIAGWAMCMLATGWLLAKHGRRNAAVTSLALVALLLALPFVKSTELRITYTFSLFAVAAVIGAIDPPPGAMRAKAAIGAALLGLACYGIPATWITLDGFRSDVRDLRAEPPPQDAHDAYPVPYYAWMRERQIELVERWSST